MAGEIENEDVHSTNNTNDEKNDGKVTQKRRSESESIALTKAKRTTSNINRLGVQEYELNDDAFFDGVQKQQTDHAADVEIIGENIENITPNLSADENSVEKAAKESSQKIDKSSLEMMSPGEKILYGKILDVLTELKVVRGVVSDLTAQYVEQIVKTNEKSLTKLKKDQLVELGLPLENVAQMKTFESKLKNDDFYKQTVNSFSICCNFMSHYHIKY